MKIAILTVCFNSEDTISQTLLSIKNQTVLPDYYLIVDGNSNDSTLEIIKDFSSLVNNVISEDDNGIYDAMNKGINTLINTLDWNEDWYVWILNSDDMAYSSTSIEEIKRTHEKHPSDCYFFSIEQFDEVRSQLWKVPENVQEALKGNSSPHPGCICSIEIYGQMGVFNERFLISSDLEWMHKVFINGTFKLYFSHKIITKMRLGGISTKGLKSKLISTKEIFKINRDLGISVIPFIFRRLFYSISRSSKCFENKYLE